mgnify:FL=1
MKKHLRKAIFLTAESPYPQIGCEKQREANLIRFLHEHMMVDVLCFEPITPDAGDSDHKSRSFGQPSGVKVSTIKREKSRYLGALRAPLRWLISGGYSIAMAKALKNHATDNTLLWISGTGMSGYIPLGRVLGCPVVLDAHGSATIKPLKLVGNQPDIITVESDADAASLSKFKHKIKIRVIPDAVDCKKYEAIHTKAGTNLFFSGSLDKPANIDGLIWFIDEILPRLRAALGENLPQVEIATSTLLRNIPHFIGNRLKREDIKLHTAPKSILPFLEKAAIVFIPIRSGSGTPMKILEAMAAGRPVVSTGHGAKNLVLSPSYDIWIANHEDAFTSAILRLLENKPLRAKVGVRAVETVRKYYNFSSVRQEIAKLLNLLFTKSV